jgi:two-component system sensor histidine kinase/response regulator
MHGCTHEEFIGLHLSAYIHPDSQPMFTEPTIGVKPEGSIFDVPAVHLHKDGSMFYVDVRRTTVPFQGRACHLSIIRDARLIS